MDVGFGSRFQQQHPHPRAWAAFGLCVVSSETGCFSQWMIWTETSILCQSFQNHQNGAECYPRCQWKARSGIAKAKASGMDCTRSLRPERPTSLLTSRSIEALVRSEYDLCTRYGIYKTNFRVHSHSRVWWRVQVPKGTTLLVGMEGQDDSQLGWP